MALPLDRYQGIDPITGLGPMGHGRMFGEGFHAGKTRAEDRPVHFIRMGGFSHSHFAESWFDLAGLHCVGCMAEAARMRQWIESLRLDDDDPPAHEW